MRSAFQRILLEQTAGITEELRAGNDNPQKTIYEVRKRCKRVRPVVRLPRLRAKTMTTSRIQRAARWRTGSPAPHSLGLMNRSANLAQGDR